MLNDAKQAQRSENRFGFHVMVRKFSRLELHRAGQYLNVTWQQLIVACMVLAYWFFHVSLLKKTHRGTFARDIESLTASPARETEEPKPRLFGETRARSVPTGLRQLKKSRRPSPPAFRQRRIDEDGVSAIEIAGTAIKTCVGFAAIRRSRSPATLPPPRLAAERSIVEHTISIPTKTPTSATCRANAILGRHSSHAARDATQRR